MQNKPLQQIKIAVIVESKYIPEEIQAYLSCFAMLGASVDLISRLWYGDYRPGHQSWKKPVFVSDVDPNDQEPWESPQGLPVDDKNDVSNKELIKVDNYDAIIMASNYVSVRLRFSENQTISDARDLVQSAPVVRFFAEAMRNKRVVKGALCHGLWILTPNPDLLKDRKVTCHTVIMADILNTGANIVLYDLGGGRKEPAKVVVDDDLVTGYSKHEVLPFVEAIAIAIIKRRQ